MNKYSYVHVLLIFSFREGEGGIITTWFWEKLLRLVPGSALSGASCLLIQAFIFWDLGRKPTKKTP